MFGVAVVLCCGVILFGLGRGGTFLVALLLGVAVLRVVAVARRRRALAERGRLRVAAAPRPCVRVRNLGAFDRRAVS